jgi:hypothetical protein
MKLAQNYYCNECQARIGLENRYLKVRDVQGHKGVREMGVVCLRCGHWHHVWFDGPGLKKPRDRFRRAQRRVVKLGRPKDGQFFLDAQAAWLETYRAFQDKMREATGIKPAIVVGDIQDGS